MKVHAYLKTGQPHKKLTEILKKHSGRDSSGKVSVPHQGGRQKRYYRMIDFARTRQDVKGTVIKIEYDPNRTANIALIEYEDGEKNYVLQAGNMKIGDRIHTSEDADIKVGNTLSLSKIPLGTEIHTIELYPGTKAQVVKSAGSFAVVVAKDQTHADIKLPSREIRKISLRCKATIGRVGNSEHKLRKYKKAGTRRLMGIRPTVRGVAQNPHSHPHGGGEGRSGESMPPKTRQGRSAHGTRTRNKKKVEQ
jgi:large subunit ribosomal protein L2